MTAKTDVELPGEEPGGLERNIAAWLANLRPTSVSQAALIESACRAANRARRCARKEDALAAGKARAAPALFDLDQKARAAALLRALTLDPLSRCDEPPTDPKAVAAMDAYYAADPARLVGELCLFVEGVEALRTHWCEMAGRLETEGYWHYPDKFAAIRLLGRRPEDSLDDPTAVGITLACRALHPEAWDAWHDHAQSRLGLENRPVYHLRVEYLEKQMPTREKAFGVLMGYIRAELSRLTGLLDGLRAERELARAEAVELALVDEGPGAALRLRYEAAASRELRLSLAEFARQRQADAEADAAFGAGDDDPAPPECKAGTTVMKEVKSEERVPAGGRTAARRNEAKLDPPAWPGTDQVLDIWATKPPEKGPGGGPGGVRSPV